MDLELEDDLEFIPMQCESCGEDIGIDDNEYACPPCGKIVCQNCWDESQMLCIECRDDEPEEE